MSERKLDALEVTYENSASSSLLLIKLQGGENIIEHQVQMVVRNAPERICPFHTVSRDGDLFCCYNITSLLTLAFFLKRRKLFKKELVKILYDVTRTLISCSGYFLDSSNYIADAEYVFINPESLEISMLYLPTDARDQRSTEVDIRLFVTDLLIYRAELKEESGDYAEDLFQKILLFIRKDSYGIKEFSLFLSELMFSGPARQLETSGKIESCLLTEDNGEDDFSERDRGGITNKSAVSSLISSIFKKPKEGKAAKKIKKIETIDTYTTNNTHENATQAVGAAIRTAVEGRTDLGGKTELLSQCKRGFPVFQPHNGCAADEITVNKAEIIIGRLEGQADYICTSSAVGRIHARIELNGGICKIVDLNSANGTFVNNVRICSNTAVELKEGDIVAFANIEYIFRAF